jgi:hypothetical protein
MIEMYMKTCIYCHAAKELSDFPKHSHYKDNLDSRCRDCVKQQTQTRKALHKIAPPKPKNCECCGKSPRKWCLDHDHKTNQIRGWLCDQCNTGIGKLGDTIESLEKALKYLKK